MRRVIVSALTVVVAAASAATTLISRRGSSPALGRRHRAATGAVSMPLAAIVAQPLVRPPPRASSPAADGGQRHRAADLPARSSRLATTAGWRWASDRGRRRRAPGRRPARRAHHARPPVRRRPRAVRGDRGACRSRRATAADAGRARRAAARAARSGTFWLLAGSFFVCGASTNGLVGTHLIPAAHDHGMPRGRRPRRCWR